jgi:malate dehydrogenase (oxaloacetate-decarboxylating)
VGQACLQLSHITRRYRGIYISPENIARIDQIFQSVHLPQVYLIVVTDGERILGLGDLGSDGMGIPVGKVALYVAAWGLHPACCLPISLDVGTNNERLLNDPLYLGYKHPRLEGKAYEEFIENFVLGVKRNFPDALLQWEDFAKHKAFKNLERYRNRILSFNDDIQGTGATALAAQITAMRIKKRILRQQFLIVGMEPYGTGISMNIRPLKGEGMSAQVKAHLTCDVQGLLLETIPTWSAHGYSPSRAPQWRSGPDSRALTFADVVHNAAHRAGGVTGKGPLLGGHPGHHRPEPGAPWSWPYRTPGKTDTPRVARATKGQGLIATGSPFKPVAWEGRNLAVSQCNNMYMFPGVGLGALVAKAPRVTDEMFLAASRAISAMVTPEASAAGPCFPRAVHPRGFLPRGAGVAGARDSAWDASWRTRNMKGSSAGPSGSRSSRRSGGEERQI